jgi:hypothetical protein
MAVPTLVSATIGVTGLTFTTVWSEPVTQNATITLSAPYRGASWTPSYASGSGTSTVVYTISPAAYLSESIIYTISAGSVVSVSTSDPNGLISGQTATNNSAVTVGCGGRAATLLVNSCSIQRAIRSQSTTSAGLKTSWGLAYAGVCCSIQGASTAESEAWSREVGDSVYRVYFPPTIDIVHTDRLTTFTGSSSLASSSFMEVVSEPIDHAGHNNVYTMVLARTLEADQ